MWAPQRAALAEHEVIAPRLYGRGQTMHEWASSIAGETDGDLAVVGASMGGHCALALARLAPEEVSEFDVRELRGAGHLVNLERPEEFNEILREFVGRV